MEKCCSVAWVAQLKQKQIQNIRIFHFQDNDKVVRRDARVVTTALLLAREEKEKKRCNCIMICLEKKIDVSKTVYILFNK